MQGEAERFFDELGALDNPRAAYQMLAEWLANTPADIFERRRQNAEILFRRIGITFAVYGDGGDSERIIPFDVIPRILDAEEWRFLVKGLEQRVNALNAFLHDIYHDREILRAGVVPEELVFLNDSFAPEMCGVSLPRNIYTQIAGIDMVRTGEKEFFVLEDNARTPSGVSYMLENREMMMRLFPDLFAHHRIAPVEQYPEALLKTLQSVAGPYCDGEPVVAVLTPGHFNSAYFEHSFLADQMGVELVEGSDLFVRDNFVFTRTTEGPQKVDVLYRRIDDSFLDPLCFRSDSALGVSGLMNAYRAGTVNLANAVGAGIADDKQVYMYVPKMISFYLGEEPILKNVETYACGDPEACAYVLEHLSELVVKEVHGSGGYGMLVGPAATRQECADYALRIKANPGGFIAQPTLALSTCPTFVDNGIAPRHVDFRPFVLSGDQVRIVPGGLTRVALEEGSLVVNSSQGGGTKDTWVLEASETSGTSDATETSVDQSQQSPLAGGANMEPLC